MTETPEISTETLQNISFEIIGKLLTAWRKPEVPFEDERKRLDWKFTTGARLHDLVIDALRYNQNLQDLAKLHKVIEELENERAIARKSGILTQPVPTTE